MHLAVHAGHFPLRRRLGRDDRHAVRHRHGDDVGQVVLTLGVVVLQRAQPLLQARGRHHQNAAVDLFNGTFGFVRVFLLDDAHNFAVFTDDAAEPGRIVLHHGQDAQLVVAGHVHQRLQRGGSGQRHVAVQYQSGGAVVQFRQGLHDGMAGAQLRFLQCGGDLFRLHRQHLQHRSAPMSVNHA